MGEAKRRGTFEQRKAEGVIKRAEAEERRKQVRAERLARLSKKTPKIALMMASMGALACDVSVPHPFPNSQDASWTGRKG